MSLSSEILTFQTSLEPTQGHGTGRPFKILPWQRAFTRQLFKKNCHVGALSLARGQGKTTWAASLATAGMLGPLAQPRAEILLAAASLRQARIQFAHVVAFIEKLTGEKLRENRRVWRLHDSQTESTLEHRPTGIQLVALPFDSETTFGHAPSLVLADEPASWRVSGANAFYGALRTSLGKIPGSRALFVGTAPDRTLDHFFSDLLEDGAAEAVALYAADKSQDPFDPATWQACMPSWRYFPELRATVKSEAKLAQKNGQLFASFRSLRLNMGCSPTLVGNLVDPELWRAIEDSQAVPDGPVYFGIDLGATASLSALAAYSPKTGWLDGVAAVPGLPSIEERERKDGARGVYQGMIDEGKLLVAEGLNVVPPAFLLDHAVARFGKPKRIAADRWREGELKDCLRAANVTCKIIPKGMGYRDGSRSIREFVTACLAGQVRPIPSLLLRSGFAAARTSEDPAGNKKIVKRTGKSRDDIAVASVLAVELGQTTAYTGDAGWA